MGKVKEYAEALEFVNLRRMVLNRDGDGIRKVLYNLTQALEVEQSTSVSQDRILIDLENVADAIGTYFDDRGLELPDLTRDDE